MRRCTPDRRRRRRGTYCAVGIRQYDSTGALKNWWTKDDKTKFEAATAKLIAIVAVYPQHLDEGNEHRRNHRDRSATACLFVLPRRWLLGARRRSSRGRLGGTALRDESSASMNAPMSAGYHRQEHSG